MKSTCPQSLDPKYSAVLNTLKIFYPKECWIKLLVILGTSCLCAFPHNSPQFVAYMWINLFSDCLDTIFKTFTHEVYWKRLVNLVQEFSSSLIPCIVKNCSLLALPALHAHIYGLWTSSAELLQTDTLSCQGMISLPSTRALLLLLSSTSTQPTPAVRKKVFPLWIQIKCLDLIQF